MAGLSVVLITWSHRSSASDLAENCPGEVEALAEPLRRADSPRLGELLDRPDLLLTVDIAVGVVQRWDGSGALEG
jgi:hypothetical protein